MKRFFGFITIVLTSLLMISCAGKQDQKAKYIFLFIGDGMSATEVDLTE